MKPKRVNAAGSRALGAFAILGLALVAHGALASAARGDLTVENLTAGAIAGVGPFFQDVDDAIRDFAAKDYAKAFSHLQAAKKSTPRLAPPEVMMAQLYFDSGQIAPGVAMLETVARQTPNDPEAYVMFAERAALEGRTSEAALMFEKASKTIDKFTENARRKQGLHVRVLNGWSAMDDAAGNLKEAAQKLEELAKVDPTNGANHQKLGHVLFRLADQKQAYAEFQAAAELDKSLPPAELAMAVLTTDKIKAEQWVNLALKKTPVTLRTRLSAAEYYLRGNQLQEAKAQADEALKLDPDGLEANVNAGVIERLLGDYKSAAAHLSTAHLLSPASAVITNHLALTLMELPDEFSHRRALEFAELNWRLNPSTPEVSAALGWINFRLNHRVEAARAFASVLSSNAMSTNPTMSADMNYYLAQMNKERGRPAEAIRLLKETLNTNHPFAYRKAAQELLAQLSKAEKAEKPQSAKGREKSSTKASEAASKSEKAEKAK